MSSNIPQDHKRQNMNETTYRGPGPVNQGLISTHVASIARNAIADQLEIDQNRQSTIPQRRGSYATPEKNNTERMSRKRDLSPEKSNTEKTFRKRYHSPERNSTESISRKRDLSLEKNNTERIPRKRDHSPEKNNQSDFTQKRVSFVLPAIQLDSQDPDRPEIYSQMTDVSSTLQTPTLADEEDNEDDEFYDIEYEAIDNQGFPIPTQISSSQDLIIIDSEEEESEYEQNPIIVDSDEGKSKDASQDGSKDASEDESNNQSTDEGDTQYEDERIQHTQTVSIETETKHTIIQSSNAQEETSSRSKNSAQENAPLEFDEFYRSKEVVTTFNRLYEMEEPFFGYNPSNEYIEPAEISFFDCTDQDIAIFEQLDAMEESFFGDNEASSTSEHQAYDATRAMFEDLDSGAESVVHDDSDKEVDIIDQEYLADNVDTSTEAMIKEKDASQYISVTETESSVVYGSNNSIIDESNSSARTIITVEDHDPLCSVALTNEEYDIRSSSDASAQAYEAVSDDEFTLPQSTETSKAVAEVVPSTLVPEDILPLMGNVEDNNESLIEQNQFAERPPEETTILIRQPLSFASHVSDLEAAFRQAELDMKSIINDALSGFNNLFNEDTLLPPVSAARLTEDINSPPATNPHTTSAVSPFETTLQTNIKEEAPSPSEQNTNKEAIEAMNVEMNDQSSDTQVAEYDIGKPTHSYTVEVPLDTDHIMEEAESLVVQDISSDYECFQIAPCNWRIKESELVSSYESPSMYERIRTTPTLNCVLETDKSIKMWWYDAFEQDDGQIYIFGKTLDKKNDKYVSCCIVVNDVQREIYVLPRKEKVDNHNIFSTETVTLDEVQIELEVMLAMKGIKDYKTEVCTRKYAFEIPDIPKETQYIKLTYSFRDYGFPENTSGTTFSHMFGNTIKPLKQFILKHDIMGPCWLQFKNWDYVTTNLSWCAVEAKLGKLGKCSVATDNDGNALADVPPLNVISLSLSVRMDHITNENKILAIGGFSCPNVDISNQESATSSPFERFAITRCTQGNQSRDTIDAVREESNKTNINISLGNSEEALLNTFLAKLQLIDADIVIGHNFCGSTLDILLHRMKKLGISSWSKLGKRITNKWPNLQSGASGVGTSFAQEQSVMSGRLICDTFIASQDLISCKGYGLTDMALSEFNVTRESLVIKSIDTPKIEVELAKHSSFDAYLAFEIAVKLQILPLTKQLTNLSGNLWSRSMNGARAERNEYLLSHTFYNIDFICPDKVKNSLNGENNRELLSFEGGLVLEPKSGLYDQYVLLLDFNSLYPSIIQEYNVCFTTMDREKIGELSYNPSSIPSIPSSDCAEGILPRLVRMFVDRRKQVKQLMKNPSLSKTTKNQYNIEQMGLKLTANSMYGCLGSPISRYYARPLAMFITSKGRDILRNTVEMTEQIGYKVIYGDTDSVMVETNTTSLASAKAIAEKIKAKINQKYKYLEIDLDGLFKRTLLLKKKKYAGLLIKEKGDGTGFEESVEPKGLESTRRDFCDIANQVSKHVLALILTSDDHKGLADKISLYLKNEATKVHNSAYKINNFIIRKQLSKAPEFYENGNLPQVLVAKSMRRESIAVGANDIVSYIMCKSENPTPHMPEDVIEGKAEIDTDYYLQNQILPPVRRLCEHVKDVNFDI